MKTLEFMAAKVPLITSAYVHSDKFIDNETGIISGHYDWYNNIKILLQNHELSTAFTINGYDIFNKYHTYEANYPILKSYLCR